MRNGIPRKRVTLQLTLDNILRMTCEQIRQGAQTGVTVAPAWVVNDLLRKLPPPDMELLQQARDAGMDIDIPATKSKVKRKTIRRTVGHGA